MIPGFGRIQRMHPGQVLVASVFIFSASACSTVRVIKSPERRTFTPPSHQVTKQIFLFGLVGYDSNVYLDQVCLKKSADQIATTFTWKNLLVSALTAGIYTPHTVQVWCEL